MKFGSTLRRLRKDQKLTLSDISRKSGIQLATLGSSRDAYLNNQKE